MNVRSLVDAVKVADATAPYDTIHLKIFYPVGMSGTNPDPQFAPFPIVIFFGGINCGWESYQWLAVTLAARGLVVVTFNWIAANFPGILALTPGVDIKNLAPNVYGTAPTASALPAIGSALESMNSEGVLAGLLDLNRLILGGHSVGGRVAIESANPSFYPQVVAAFAYGAHTAAIVQLGYPAGTILSLGDRLPMMLMGGTCDGVIANSSSLYGLTWERPTTPIERTFQAMAGGNNDRYLLLIKGANHFAIADPVDLTLGTSALDFPATQPPEQTRTVIADAIGLFIDVHARMRSTAIADFERLQTSANEAIASFIRK